MNIGVFCSQYDVAEKYQAATRELGELIASGGHALVWGGADEGLMGLVAHTAKNGGAKVIGIMREVLRAKALQGADEMHVVSNAYEMNLGIIERSDAVMALAGGIGTLNELTELIRMNKNGQHAKRVVFINTDGFYDGFRAQIARMTEEGFVRPDVAKTVYFAATPSEAMQLLA